MENANSETEFYGAAFSGSKMLLTAEPRFLLGQNPSDPPQILPGYKFQGNSFLSGVNANELSVTNGKIQFPATQSSSTNANTLDDYEEGLSDSWTPTDASGAGLSLTVDACKYIKVGRLVTVAGMITFPATADVTNAKVGGLPFTVMTDSSNAMGGHVIDSDDGSLAVLFEGNATTFVLLNPTTGAARTNANLSGNYFRFCLSYFASA